ncbi:MAG: hypothetical protein K9K32_05610 [Halanaerobiales bacterium]|nr:hypothetical protein [Halanaerobiales bacterium]
MQNTWLTNYVKLTLRVDKLFIKNNGYYIDAYIGPKELKEEISKEKIKKPIELIKELDQLLTSLKEVDFKKTRKKYLKKQLIAIKTILRIINGEDIILKDEVELILDIEYSWVEESSFEKGLQYFKEGLPKKGELTKRYEEWITRNMYNFKCSKKKREYLEYIIKEMANLSKKTLKLPEKENINLNFVSNKHYGASTRYLGNYISLVEINEDIPFNFFQLLPLITHELYPGHHTEFCLKEEHLINKRKYFENNIFLLNSPQLVISEGLGEVAFDIIFTLQEATEWMEQNIYKKFNINTDDLDLKSIIKASRYNSLDQISSNAAIMLDQGYSKDMVKKYIKKYSLQNDVMIDHIVKNLNSSEFKKIYSFTYYHGKKIISDYLYKAKDKKLERLNYLLKSQVYPSLITNNN